MEDTIDKITGLVYRADGTVLGRKNWIVQADVTTYETKEVVVKAIDEKEAEEKVMEMWERKYKSKKPYIEITACWSPD